MSIDCRKVRDALFDMAYADPGMASTSEMLDDPIHQLTGQGRLGDDASAVDVVAHLRSCPECREYADALVDIASFLPTSRSQVTTDFETGGVDLDWSRLGTTIERGIKMRIARERRNVALFALIATGILAAVWVPLLVWNPGAFLSLQAVGFFGIALFYLPIHVLRGRRGDAA